MRKESWNKDTIENEYVKYKNLLRFEKDEALKKNYGRITEDLSTFLIDYIDDEEYTLSTGRDLSRVIKDYNRYSFLNNCINIFNGHTFDIVGCNIFEKDENLPKVNLSVNDHLSCLFDFYKSLNNKEIFEAFLINYEKSDNILNITNAKHPGHGSCGYTYFLETLNTNYIQIFDHHDGDVPTTLAHEYAHALANSLNSERRQEDNNLLYTEIEGLFFELLYSDYLNKEVATGFNKNKYNVLKTMFKYSEDILDMDAIITLYSENKDKILPRMKVKEIEKLFKEDPLYNGVDLFFSMQKDYPALYKYIYSYLISIELYHIYKENPSYALNLIKQIMVLDGNTKFNKVLKDMKIKPNENLIKELKLIKKGL